MSVHDILIMVEFALVGGIAAYVLADRLRLPAIVFLMLLGVVVGPEVLSLVDPAELGGGLRVLVSIAVGIIVFEGGMLLDFDEMRAASPPIRNLVTLGVMIAVVSGTLVAWLVAGLPFKLAMLFGALMCVTGPTVITPLLKRANVSRRLGTVLQSEAVLVDAIGAVLAVVALEFIIHSPEDAVMESLRGFVSRLGVGTLIGLGGGLALVMILRRLRNLPASTVRLASLGGALAVYAGAEFFITEAGIVSVALAGIMLGNMDTPYHDEVKKFKGDLTNLGIIFLFVLLAAGLRFETFTAFSINGWGGVIAVVMMMLLVRPASVMLSTIGTGLPLRERLYIAALGPRGVVAAAIALFAELELMANNYQNVDSFIGLVFMTIMGTVVIQGLLAAPMARWLGVKSMQVVIVSADDIGRELARRLEGSGYSATLVDTDLIQVNRAREMGLNAMQCDGTNEQDLKDAGLSDAQAFVAATSSDKTNLLACQIAMQRFGLENVVARVNKPDNLENFESLGIRVTSPVISSAMLLDSLVQRSTTLELLTSQVPGREVCEVVLSNTHLTGKPLREWNLTGDVLVALVRRDGDLFVPHGDTTLREGDLLTLLGSCDDVEEMREQVG